MNSEVLKPFGYAADHINIAHFNVGDVGDFGDSTEGLTKEGFVKPAKADKKPAVEAVKEPEVVKVAEPVNEYKPAEPVFSGKSKRK